MNKGVCSILQNVDIGKKMISCEVNDFWSELVNLSVD